MSQKNLAIRLMSFSLWAVVSIGVMSGLGGCTSSKTISAPIPTESSQTAIPPTEVSSINIPVVIQAAEIQRRLNSEYDGILYKDDSFDDNGKDNVKIRVTKLSPFRVSAENGKLTVIAPLRIWIRGRYLQDFGFTTADLQRELQFDINARFNSALFVTSDWKLKTASEGVYEWVERPSLDFGPVKIPVSLFADGPLRSQLTSLAAMFDKEVAKNTMLYDLAKDAFNEMLQPVLIDEANQTWLSMQPKELLSTKPTLANGAIAFQLGLQSIIKVSTGPKPQIAKIPLPKLIIANSLPPDFGIFVEALVDYSSIKKTLVSQFVGKPMTFDEGTYQVDFCSFDVFPKGDKLILSTTMTAKKLKGFVKKKLSGNLVFEAIPKYDAATKEVYLEQVDFEFATSDKLARSADWLLHKRLTKAIESSSRFNLEKELATTKKNLQDQFTNYRMNDQVLINAVLSGVEPQIIVATPEGLLVRVKMTGTVKAVVDKL